MSATWPKAASRAKEAKNLLAWFLAMSDARFGIDNVRQPRGKRTRRS